MNAKSDDASKINSIGANDDEKSVSSNIDSRN